MAVVHDARVLELVEELGGDRVRDLFRELLQGALQELIDAELTEAIGAAPHERTDTRTNHRNGGRPRLLSTPAGDVQLQIPKVRVGSFFPSLLEPRRRVDRALWAEIAPLPPSVGPEATTPCRPGIRSSAYRAAACASPPPALREPGR